MRLSLNGANRSREATHKVPAFSKQWEPGTKLRCFYRTYTDEQTGRRELLAGACWGHKVLDMKSLSVKTTFIPSLCEYDQDGRPVGKPDILWRFSHLAPYFIKGKQLAEEEAIQSRQFPNEALRREALNKIAEKYDKDNLQGIKPVIGKAQMLITVEVVVVPYKDDKPVVDVPVIACQPVSSRLAKRLDSILHDSKFAPADDEEFLEIEWDFPLEDGNKAKSGQAAVPSGVTREYRMATQFPTEFEKVALRFPDVSNDSDMVRKRATSGVKESVIEQAIKSYSFMNIDGLEGCAKDEDTLENAMQSADVIGMLDLKRAINEPLFTQRLEKELEELKGRDMPMPEVDESAPTEAAEAPKAAPTVEDLLQQQAANAPKDAVESMDSALDDVDLGAFAANEQ